MSKLYEELLEGVAVMPKSTQKEHGCISTNEGNVSDQRMRHQNLSTCSSVNTIVKDVNCICDQKIRSSPKVEDSISAALRMSVFGRI